MIDLRLGQQRPVRMRRIGTRHMIVMPPQQAQLLSVDAVEQQLQQARVQRQAQQAQVGRLDAFIADLEQQLAAFKALPIERDAEDPDVPQPEVERIGGPGVQSLGLAQARRNALAAVPSPEPPVLLTDS